MAALEELPEQNCQEDVHGAYYLAFSYYKIQNTKQTRKKIKYKMQDKLRKYKIQIQNVKLSGNSALLLTSPVVVSYVLHHG